MKATPDSAPASYDSVMSLYREVVEALVHDSDAVFDAETRFCAEVERLAAQSAPTEAEFDKKVLTALECGCIWTEKTEAHDRMLHVTEEFRKRMGATVAQSAPLQQAAREYPSQKYDDVLLPFLTLMRKELHANSGKGDRPGWLAMDANTALLEVYWHTAKLSAAVKNNDGPAIMEHSADVANMAMMVLDVCGGLVQVDADRAAAQVEPVRMPPEIAAIAERLHTQNNRITQDPLFAVQQKRRIYGVDTDYTSQFEWSVDGETWTPESGEEPPENARRVGYIDIWEFVTGCFTEQGCKDFIACNGHNLKQPRIYAYGSYRNAEFIAMRKWLMSLSDAVIPADGEVRNA